MKNFKQNYQIQIRLIRNYKNPIHQKTTNRQHLNLNKCLSLVTWVVHCLGARLGTMMTAEMNMDLHVNLVDFQLCCRVEQILIFNS